MRALSHTQMSMYLRCPQQWKQKYVDGREEEPKPYLTLGSAVHRALEVFYDRRVAAPASLEEMEAAFDEEFDPEAFESEEEAERARADGLAMVRAFHEEHAPAFAPAFHVESTLRFELAGERVVAKLDRVDRTDDGGLRVVDYKTGKPFTLDRVEEDPQLTLYQVAAERKLGMPVESLVLYHVPSQTPLESGRRGPEEIDRLRKRVRRVAEGIRREEYEPDPGPYCEWCDFRPWCPAWADEYPENWEEEPAPPAPDRAEARRLADRYGELKARRSEIREELEEIRSKLERYFGATGERSVAGERHGVRATRWEKFDLEDDELKELLAPHGLWEGLLSPHWRAIQSLVDDEEVPPEVRERMREIARVEERWRLRAFGVEGGDAGEDGAEEET